MLALRRRAPILVLVVLSTLKRLPLAVWSQAFWISSRFFTVGKSGEIQSKVNIYYDNAEMKTNPFADLIYGGIYKYHKVW